MNKLIVLLSLVLSQASYAAIAESTYDVRHGDLIESAIEKNCGRFRELTQVASKQVETKIDQGIRDIKFTTILTGLDRQDQNIFHKYVITVESEYTDMYDHSAKDWGAYNVVSVSCNLE